jgi:hypothetical protein
MFDVMAFHVTIFFACLQFSDPPMSNILSSAEDDQWQMVRRGVAPAFAMTNIK